jgi:hypothetical protein
MDAALLLTCAPAGLPICLATTVYRALQLSMLGGTTASLASPIFARERQPGGLALNNDILAGQYDAGVLRGARGAAVVGSLAVGQLRSSSALGSLVCAAAAASATSWLRGGCRLRVGVVGTSSAAVSETGTGRRRRDAV